MTLNGDILSGEIDLAELHGNSIGGGDEMDITIKLFAADGDYRGEFSAVEMDGSDDVRDAIREELERGGHAELWADGQRVFDDPAATLEELAGQLEAAR